MEKKKVFCPGCSILCDDIYIEMENGKIQHVLNTCTKGFEKFHKMNDNRLSSAILNEDGQEKAIALDESLAIFADLLKDSKKPLFLLGDHNSLEEITKTLELAGKVNGIVASPGAQRYMKLFAKMKEEKIEVPTYEDIINYVDGMIFWGTNPSATHLRHASKFSVLTRGEKIRKGKEDRYVLLIDVRKTETRVLTDEFIKLETGQDLLVMDALIALVNDKEINSLEFDFPVKDLKTVNKHLLHSDQIVFLVGEGLCHGSEEVLNKFLNLVKSYKEKGKNVKIMPMVETLGVANYVHLMLESHDGIQNINFETRSEIKILNDSTLEKIDLIVYLNFDPIEHLAFSSIQGLLKKKSVYLGSKRSWISELSSLSIPTSINFIETSGTAIRLDLKQVNQDPLMQSSLGTPSPSEVLNKITANL